MQSEGAPHTAAAGSSSPVGVEAIDHVQLAMPAGREDDARAFYSALLGIPEHPKPPHLAARGGCWFESETLKLHLGVEADFRPAKKAHPALLVRDLPALVQNLRDAAWSWSTTNPSRATTACMPTTRSGTVWSSWSRCRGNETCSDAL